MEFNIDDLYKLEDGVLGGWPVKPGYYVSGMNWAERETFGYPTWIVKSLPVDKEHPEDERTRRARVASETC